MKSLQELSPGIFGVALTTGTKKDTMTDSNKGVTPATNTPTLLQLTTRMPYYILKKRVNVGERFTTAHETIMASGKKETVIRVYGTYAGQESNAQFYVECNGKIVAIEVHAALLWLDKVPPPEYFHGRPKRTSKPEDKALIISPQCQPH
jgi:hypothetical protein